MEQTARGASALAERKLLLEPENLHYLKRKAVNVFVAGLVTSLNL